MTTAEPAVRLGIMADPGLPEQVAQAVGADLAEHLAEHVTPARRWEVEVVPGALPMMSDGTIPLRGRAGEILERHGWDLVVYLTDLPRSLGGNPLVCEVDTEEHAAMVSVPSFGAWGIHRRTRRLITSVVGWLQRDARIVRAPTREGGAPTGTAVRSGEPGDTAAYLVLTGPLRRIRLLAGMVRDNQPGRLLPALSTAMATAVASGAFGIFYTSIWSMSDALPLRRFFLVSIVVILGLTAWLIVHNGLWARGEAQGTAVGPRLDNLSTFVTVGLGVLLMYAVLYVILLVAALAVVDADYLGVQLGHPVGFGDYATLAWLAASLGTAAGALGSNFDSDSAIRAATYSRREQQRRALEEEREERLRRQEEQQERERQAED